MSLRLKQMGRPKKQVNEETLLQMRGEGKYLKEISKEMGVSTTTLSRRIVDLHHKKGILTKHRQLQGLQLTALQARILETIDSKNFEDVSLIELLRAFHVLWKVEKSIQGKESFKVWGLLDHLLALENEPIKRPDQYKT